MNPEKCGRYICAPRLQRQNFWVVLITLTLNKEGSNPVHIADTQINVISLPILSFFYFPQMISPTKRVPPESFYKTKSTHMKGKLPNFWLNIVFSVVAYETLLISHSRLLFKTNIPLRNQHWQNIGIDLWVTNCFPFFTICMFRLTQ